MEKRLAIKKCGTVIMDREFMDLGENGLMWIVPGEKKDFGFLIKYQVGEGFVIEWGPKEVMYTND